MPRLPSAEDYQGQSAPRRTREVANVQPADAGAGLKAIGAGLEKLYEEEAQRIDNWAVQKAMNELTNTSTQLAFGDDGYARKQGDKALERGLTDTYLGRYDSRVAELAENLATPRAREMFNAQAGEARARFGRDMVYNMVKQSEKAIEDTSAAAAKIQLSTVANNPNLLSNAIKEAGAPFVNVAKNMPATMLDYTVREQRKGMVVAAFDGYLAQKDYNGAASILDNKEYADYLGPDAAKMRAKLDANVVGGVGTSLGEAAIGLYRQGKTEDEVLKYVRENLGSTHPEDVYKVAKSVLDGHIAAERDSNIQRMSDMVAPIIRGVAEDGKKVNGHAAWAKLSTSKEFNALSSEAQLKAKSLVDAEFARREAQTRAAQSDSRERKYEVQLRLLSDPRNVAEVDEYLSDPMRLARTSEAEFLGMTSRLGEKHVGTLISAKRSHAADAKAFKVDMSVIDSTLAVVDSAEKRKLMKMHVLHGVERWKDANKGVRIPDDTVRAIAANATRTVVERGFFSGREYFIGKSPEDLKDTYRPVQHVVETGGKKRTITEEIPGDFYAQALDAVPQATDAWVLKKWLEHKRRVGKQTTKKVK